MMRQISSLRLLVAATGLGLLCAGLAVRPAAAQIPAVSAPSAEELAIGLLPYRLTDADLPEGYAVSNISADTPMTEAFNLANTAADGSAALQAAVSSGLLSGFLQSIDPKQATPVRQLQFNVDLYSTPAAASAALHDGLRLQNTGTIQSDNPPLGVKLGDESGALHVVATKRNGITDNIEAIGWRRGRVLFQMTMVVPDATETIDQVVPFAQAADAHAAGVTAPAVRKQAQLAVTSTEATRIDAAFALYDRLPGSSLAPYGLRPSGANVITNADLVLQAKDPAATYASRIAATGRIVDVQGGYTTLQADANDQVSVDYVLCATRAGAQAELAGPLFDGVQFTVDGTYALPQPLGDSSALYHATLAHADGITSDVWGVVWTHGNVVLRVVTASPTSDISAQQATAFAANVDGYYNRGALPAVLTSADPGSVPSSSPVAPSNPVAARATG